MRLAFKLVLVFMLANVALAAIYGYLAIRREVIQFRQRVEAEAEEVAPVMEKLLIDAWRTEGDRGVKESLRRIVAGRQQPLRIRWVWFDTRAGDNTWPGAPIERITAIVIQEHIPIEADEPDGISYEYVYWPVTLAAERQGGLEFALPMTELAASEREIIDRTALLIGGMVLISGLLAVFLGVRLVGRPLEHLIARTRRIGSGELDCNEHLRTHDEFAELAENLNAMCANLAESQNRLRQESAARILALEQLRHADRLKTVGRLASGIAHELGTPLNVVAGRAGLIASGKLDAEQIAQSAAAIKQQADKMTAIIRQLLDFARASTPCKLPVDLRTIVRQTIDMLDAIAEKQKVQLIFATDAEKAPDAERFIAEIDAGQIQQVLANLTINAVQAMPAGGKVEFFIRRRFGPPPEGRADGGGSGGDAPDDGRAAPPAFFGIEVHDQGIGIPDEHMQQLFEPFFTTKDVGAGTGLGLSIAYGIVQEHGGWIDVTSQVGKGSCFTVFLPEGVKP